MTRPPDLSGLSSSEKDALITAVLAQVDALTARVAALEAENAALRDKLTRPPKTPANSSLPPSHGPKANGAGQAKPKGQPHAGGTRSESPGTGCDGLTREACRGDSEMIRSGYADATPDRS